MIIDRKIPLAEVKTPSSDKVTYFTDLNGNFSVMDNTRAVTNLQKGFPTYVCTLEGGGTRAAPIDAQIQAFIDRVENNANYAGCNIVLDGPAGIYWVSRQIRLRSKTGLIGQPDIWFRCTTTANGLPDSGNYTDHFARFPGGFMFAINRAYTDNTYSAFSSANWVEVNATISGAVFHSIVLRQDVADLNVPCSLLTTAAPHDIANCFTFYAHDLVVVPSVYMDNLNIRSTRAAYSYQYRNFLRGTTATVGNPGTFTWVGHQLMVGDALVISATGAIPGGLTQAGTYYVKEFITADTFTISSTLGGAALAITTTGSNVVLSAEKPSRDMTRYTGRVVLPNTGDYVILDNVHGNIRLGFNRGAQIRAGAGNIWLNNSVAVMITDRHEESEYQWVQADNSTLTIDTCHYWKGRVPKIRLNNSQAIIRGLECEWICNNGIRQTLAPHADIALTMNSSFVLDKCYAVTGVHGNVGEKFRSGVSVASWVVANDSGLDDGVGFTQLESWNRYSHLLSTHGQVDSGFKVRLNYSLEDLPNDPAMDNREINSFQTIDSANIRWNKTGQVGTVEYYYKFIDAIDWERKFCNLGALPKLGPARTNGGVVTRINYHPLNNHGTHNGHYPRMVVMLRVANTGQTIDANTVYDDIAFIAQPTQAFVNFGLYPFFDVGDYINGVKWQAFGQSVAGMGYRVSAASWKNGKFTGVIPTSQARPANAAGVSNLQGNPGDQLLLDSPVGGGPVGYVKTADNATLNKQWRAFGTLET